MSGVSERLPSSRNGVRTGLLRERTRSGECRSSGSTRRLRTSTLELIRGPARPGPWKTVEDVELATLSWVHWHNTTRLHGYLGDIQPAEFEQTFYATKRTDQPLVEIQ